MKKPLRETSVNCLLKRLGEKCGIKKRIYPHLLRHTRITELGAKLSGTILNNYIGWKTGSSMSEVYVHHNRKWVDQAVLRNIYNITHFDKSQEVVERLLPQLCYNCGERNVAEVDYCTKCNAPLKIEEFKKRIKQNEWIVNKIIASPEMLRAFIKMGVQKAVEELVKLRSEG